MASEFIVSPLTHAQQAERLSRYVLENALALSPAAAFEITAQLDLSRAQEKKAAVRLFVALLAAHGVELSYQRSLEVIARMCGGDCWMRVRRQLMPRQSILRGEIFLIQSIRGAEDDGEWVARPTLADAATGILDDIKARWPTEIAPSLCTFHVGPQAICVELEHPTAEWLKFNLVGWDAAAQEPVSHDLEPSEARRFVQRLSRTLEHAFSGLLVLGALRPHTQPPWFHFIPELHVPAKGFRKEMVELEFLMLTDELQCSHVVAAKDGTIDLLGSGDAAHISVRWISGADQVAEEPARAVDIQALFDRISRVRRATGLSASQFIQHLGCGGTQSEGYEQIAIANLEKLRQARKCSWADVAEAAGVPVNDVLRMSRYGFARPELLEKIADALDVSDPNCLLPQDGDEQRGFRLDAGKPLFLALKDTHWWGRIFGEQLKGERREEVERIGESIVEWIDLYQFTHGQFSGPGEPMDDATVIAELQQLLEELTAMGVALIVSCSMRFAKLPEGSQRTKTIALRQAQLFFELEAALQPSRTIRRAA